MRSFAYSTYYIVFGSHLLISGIIGHSIELKLNQESELQTTECNHYGYFFVDATHPCDDLFIQVKNISGEPNLYVSREPYEFPTYRSLAWSSYEWGGESLTISSWDPNFKPGRFFIGVHSYCGKDVPTGNQDAKYTVLAKHASHRHPVTEDIFNRTESGVVAEKAYNYHRFCLPSECYKVEVRLSNCIDPTECPTSYAWPELIISPTHEKATEKSMAWILGESEHRSIVLNPSDPTVIPGHYYITVFGWCTPDAICHDKSQCGPCSYAQNTHYNISVQPIDLCISHGVRSMATTRFAMILSFLVHWSLNM